MTHKDKDNIPTQTRKIKRTRRITTVEDLFTRDDINEILEGLNKNKSSIEHLVVIYTDKDHNRFWIVTEGTFVSTAVFMLEATKFDILNDDNKED